MIAPTARFSDRVENYIRFRPGYPAEILGALEEVCGLSPASKVADIGSGTGILTEIFLKNGNEVTGVEPNREMRLAAVRLLAAYPGFRSVAAAAEATGLDGGSVDIVVAGQAFHWFDRTASRAEFHRILKPGGWVVLIWNERRLRESPFLVAYEDFLRRHGTDYEEVNHAGIDEAALAAFYHPGRFERRVFFNQQAFDLEGLRGRLLSSSYIPLEGHPGHAPMLAELAELFERHQSGGKVCLDYDTKVYLGRLEGAPDPDA